MKTMSIVSVLALGMSFASAIDFSSTDAKIENFRQAYNRKDCAKIEGGLLQISNGGISSQKPLPAPGSKLDAKTVKKLVMSFGVADCSSIHVLQLAFSSQNNEDILGRAPYIRAGFIELNSKAPYSHFLQSVADNNAQIATEPVKNVEYPLGKEFDGKKWKAKLELDAENFAVFIVAADADFPETPVWKLKHNQNFAKWDKGVFGSILLPAGTVGDYAKALKLSSYDFTAVTE
jgi:hypothetical protein